jgi:hypothetical protein
MPTNPTPEQLIADLRAATREDAYLAEGHKRLMRQAADALTAALERIKELEKQLTS